MKTMKKWIAVILSALTVCTILSPMVSAKSVGKAGITSDPSISYFHPFKDGSGGAYQIDIHTGDTITLWLVNSSGKQIRAPKGGHVEWAADPFPTGSIDGGKVKLTPSEDGSTCTLKAVKGGENVAVIAQVYDKNNKKINEYFCMVQSRYTPIEWVIFYLTLGMYGINWKNEFTGIRHELTYDDPWALLMDLVMMPGIVLLQPFELIRPWEKFDIY
jgi:hypothetical protein